MLIFDYVLRMTLRGRKKATQYICLIYFKFIYTQYLCFNEYILTFWSSEIALLVIKGVWKCYRLLKELIFRMIRRHLTHTKKQLTPIIYQ